MIEMAGMGAGGRMTDRLFLVLIGIAFAAAAAFIVQLAQRPAAADRDDAEERSWPDVPIALAVLCGVQL
jgi:hypothetical protein